MLNIGQTKPFKTIEEQLDLLISRGLIVNDKEFALSILKRINYYRLSAYSLTLRSDDTFHENVTFDEIYSLYCFDAELRKIVLEYSLHIEIAFRTYISYYHAQQYGALGYMDAANFKNASYHSSFISELDSNIKRSKELFIKHHKNNLHSVFPIWVSIEATTLGMLSKFYKNMKPDDCTYISKNYYSISRNYIENRLQVCSYMRNVAAHGGRFYYSFLKATPVKLSRLQKEYINQESVFAGLFVMYKLLPTDELKKSFLSKLDMLFNQLTFQQLSYIGVDSDWKSIIMK